MVTLFAQRAKWDRRMTTLKLFTQLRSFMVVYILIEENRETTG